MSFWFTATAVLFTILCAYFAEILPSQLYNTTDHLVLRLFKRGSRSRTPTTVEVKQKRLIWSDAVAKFLHATSDQQLITGLAIMIAALSNRCHISLYEFHIVVSLAYFSVTSHVLTLDVLRQHLSKYTLVRNARILCTVAFFGLFSSLYIIDRWVYKFDDGRRNYLSTLDWPAYKDMPYLNSDSILQCVFLKPLSSADLSDGHILFVLVLLVLAVKHIATMTGMIGISSRPNGNRRQLTERLLDTVCSHRCCRLYGFAYQDSVDLVHIARDTYDTYIRRPKQSPGILSVHATFTFESYSDSYLSEIPIWLFQFIYGTSSTVGAVWQGQIEVAKDIIALGFGQVVAIGLLALLILAVVQIVNGEKSSNFSCISTASNISKEQRTMMKESQAPLISNPPRIASMTAPATQNPRTAVGSSLGTRAQSDLITAILRKLFFGDRQKIIADVDGMISSRQAYVLDDRTARRVAILSVVVCLATIILALFTALTWVGYPVLFALAIAWASLQLCVLLRRFTFQMFFIEREMEFRRQQSTDSTTTLPAAPTAASPSTPQSPTAEHSSSASIGSADPSNIHMVPLSAFASVHTSSTQVFESAGSSRSFNPPRRQDTEADMGLVPPVRRRTHHI